MLFSNVCIESVAYEIPTQVLTTEAITDQIGSTMDRLGIPRHMFFELTGIKERRFWEGPVKPSDVASRVAREAIIKAGIEPGALNLVVNSSIWRDQTEPATASMVHGNLCLSTECVNFDITNPCLGFVNGITIAAQMIESGAATYALVVSGETMEEAVYGTVELLKQPETDVEVFRDNFATLTLGSGAVAMVLSHKNVTKTCHRVNGVVNRSGTEYNRLCIGNPPYMKTDASALLRASVDLGRTTWQAAVKELPRWQDPETIYIPHQVGMRHVTTVNKAMGDIKLEQVYLTFPLFGNMGSAAIPVALAMAVEEGCFKEGQHVGLVGFGSGLNSGFMSISW